MFLCAVAFAQVTFVPGYLALCLFGSKRGSLIETLAVSFALSLLSNYLFVFALAALGLYTRTATLVLVLAEAVLLTGLVIRRYRHETLAGPWLTLPRLRQSATWKSAIVWISCAALALFAAATVRAVLRMNVFDGWDPLFEWNYWAMPWYRGIVPQGTMLYPQLIPANWSVMYTILGSPEIQSVPLSIMPLFVLGVLALFLDLSVRRRRSEYLVALVLCAVALFAIRGRISLASGHVDMAVTFLSMVALYLVELKDDRRLNNWREMLLPLLVAAAASVTKPNGLFVLAVVLLLAVAGHYAQRHRLTAAEWMKSGLLAVGVVGVVPGVWYGTKLLDIAAGRDITYYNTLVDVASSEAGRATVGARLLHAATHIPGSWAMVALLVLTVLACLRVPRARWVALGVFVPYTLLWAGFLSYDIRNELLMVPVASYLLALAAIAWLVERRSRDAGLAVLTLGPTPVQGRAVIGIAIASIVAAAVLAASPPISTLERRHLELQRKIGSESLNKLLYEVQSRQPGIAGSVLTDYHYLETLPGFREDPLRREHNPAIHTMYIWPTSITIDDLRGRDWLLLSDLVPADVQSVVDQRIADKSYTVVFATDVHRAENAYPSDARVRLIRVDR